MWRVGLVLSVFASAGCRADRAAVEERTTELAVAVAAKNPLSSVEAPAAGELAWSGRVEEVLPASGYAYLRVRCDDDVERWVVTLAKPFAVGEAVRIKNMGTRRDFHSKRLGRTFERLVFAIVRSETDARRG